MLLLRLGRRGCCPRVALGQQEYDLDESRQPCANRQSGSLLRSAKAPQSPSANLRVLRRRGDWQLSLVGPDDPRTTAGGGLTNRSALLGQQLGRDGSDVFERRLDGWGVLVHDPCRYAVHAFL